MALHTDPITFRLLFVSFDTGSTLQQLIKQVRPSLTTGQCQSLALELFQWYSEPATQAVRSQDLTHVRALCEMWDERPRPTTIRRLGLLGIQLGEQLQHVHPIWARWGEDELVVVKRLDIGERGGYQKLSTAMADTSAEEWRTTLLEQCLVPFQWLPPEPSVTPPTDGHTARSWVVMPRYVDSLDTRPRPISHNVASRLIRRMLTALHSLHELGLVHMDVKPSNIMESVDCRTWLADFGSVCRLGCMTIGVTSAFVPADLSTADEVFWATREMDHWLLGATVVDILSASHAQRVGVQGRQVSTKEVRELGKIDSDEARELLSLLPRPRAL